SHRAPATWPLPPVYRGTRQDCSRTASRRKAVRADPAPGVRAQEGPGRKGAVRVLVVEDEQLLADAVATGLRREAMAVDVVYDGAAAQERIDVNDYDVVVLDRDLPVVHGDDVCRRIVELGLPTRVL